MSLSLRLIPFWCPGLSRESWEWPQAVGLLNLVATRQWERWPHWGQRVLCSTLGAGIAWAGLYVNEVISFRDRSQRPRADGLAANASWEARRRGPRGQLPLGICDFNKSSILLSIYYMRAIVFSCNPFLAVRHKLYYSHFTNKRDSPAHGHRVSKWQILDANLRLYDSNTHALKPWNVCDSSVHTG